MIEYEIHRGTSSQGNRTANEAPPVLTLVEIESWGGDEQIERIYSSLGDADRALRDAADHHLDSVAGTAHALVRVEWADGASHRTSVHVDMAALRRDRGQGLIKSHLVQQCFDLANEPDESLRAWSVELRHRLKSDNGELQSLGEWSAWQQSLAFIPSTRTTLPVVEAVTVAVGGSLEPPPVETGENWDTLAEADIAVARFVASRRHLNRGGAVHIRVRWVDGMAFRFWSSVADLVNRPRTIAERMEDHARYIASPQFAASNARTSPRRPLDPQRAWARELLRRVAPDGDRGAGGPS